ncbi:neuropeptide FF receptor 2 isoform X2 [Crotalus tigris]|nr:neuropeptide FF receptor 2 isoform X2 [Crotalus tigris]XP_039211066.1 neuropeptide FF receptor 2 isoform X2 [Crotalus tigris]XP_039211067.1 neuropeptide FF receptor 2 isoform X2 [Crotalus tigris]XP_039211068.1 neuropeptide FF receptor 2 isoform X2 [Crotalus tigris]
MDKKYEEPGSSQSELSLRNCTASVDVCQMEPNITYVGFYLHHPLVASVYIISYLLIFLLCMIGNGIVCFTILQSKHMHTVTNLFILNLAVSDLLVGIFCMPTTLLDNLITGWPFGSVACKMNGTVQGISVSASVFTLVAIAVDRFRSIVYPFKPKLTVWIALMLIAIIWVLAVAIMCPSAVMLKLMEEKHFQVILEEDNQTRPIYWCREDWPNEDMKKIYTTVLFANIYLAPLSLIVIMYARIGITLFNTVLASGKQGHERHSVYKKKLKVIKMLIIVALLFILSWLPLWTLAMLSDYAELDEAQHKLINIYVYPFAHWLAFFNSSINPIIYGFFNENFRRGFQAAFQLQLCSGEVIPREMYSQRAQSNAVLPVTVPQQIDHDLPSCAAGRSTQKGNWVDKTQVLVMENLEGASNDNGTKQDLL